MAVATRSPNNNPVCGRWEVDASSSWATVAWAELGSRGVHGSMCACGEPSSPRGNLPPSRPLHSAHPQPHAHACPHTHVALQDLDLRKKRKEATWEAMNPEATGKNADTVFRDRKGRKLDMLTEMQRQEEARAGHAVAVAEAKCV